MDGRDAAVILAELEAAGVTFRVEAGRLVVGAAAPLTAEQRAFIAGHWQELTAMAQERQAGEALAERLLARLPPGGYGRAAWLCDWGE